jgi:hypothetical protein
MDSASNDAAVVNLGGKFWGLRLTSQTKRLLVVVAAAVMTVAVLGYPVSDNIRYVVGLLRVSGFPVTETFTHRPIAYRLIIAAHSWLPEAVSGFFGQPHSGLRIWAFETGFRAVGAVVAAAAAVTLWAGLRRRWRSVAWDCGLAAYAALVLTGPIIGEPDWYAAVFAVAAVGAGLLGSQWAGGFAAGVLLALAALVKLVTLPVAVVALLFLLVLDRERGVAAGIAAFVSGVLALAAIWLWLPWEVSWMLDIGALQPGFWMGLDTITDAWHYAVRIAMIWPVILLVPTFFVRSNPKVALVAAAALVLMIAPVILQGEYWLYHAVGLIVLSAVLALHAIVRTRGALFWPLVVCSLFSAMTYHLPPGFGPDGDVTPRKSLVVLLVALGLAVWQWWTIRNPLPRACGNGFLLAGLAVLIAMLASQMPAAMNAVTRSKNVNIAVATQVRSVVGVDTPVVYLAPGWSPYFIGNPTHCRYPSPLFLQRKLAVKNVAEADRQDNLNCVGYPQAQWLIVNQRWFSIRKSPADVKGAVATYWRCEDHTTVGDYAICPRRR